MLDNIFQTVLTGTITAKVFFICTLTSLILGAIIAVAYTFKGHYTSSFVVTLALLPAIVQAVIILVDGNLGTGVAVMGAFSLVRFRSIPGSAREIGSIFLAMAIGLATGTGYVGVAVVFALIIVGMNLLYSFIKFGENKKVQKELKITIPENLDYSGLFDDLFDKYATEFELERVKTSNMGSLYQLSYLINLKDSSQEKAFLDEIRCRNGNLDISCGKVSTNREEL